MKKTEIRMILQRIGLIPRKIRGQNFLASDKIAEQIVEAAGVHPNDFVVEIGPGLGMVTEKILKTGARVLAVEIDEKLALYLKERFAQQRNFTLLRDDFLSLSPETIRSYNGSRPPVFITNPPYRGAKRILKRIITKNQAQAVIITLQHEVARAVLAAPGTKSANSLSYIVYYRFLPQKLFDIPQNFFYPQPSIDSTTILLSARKRPVAGDEAFFYHAVEQLMHSRRRTLKNGIKATYPIPVPSIDKLLSTLGLAATSRPNDLTVKQMAALTSSIKKAVSS